MRTRGSHPRFGPSRAAALAMLLAWCVAVPAGAAADFSKYHNYQELSAALKAAASAQPALATLVSIGKTREGRDLWALEIAGAGGPPAGTRPGLLIAANFEGDHLVGSELALFIIESLLASYATDAAVKDRLDSTVIYVVPRMNPDGAEQMFAAIKAPHRTNLTPYDDDNDGRTDEDGPEDLNKDGVITVMRVKDPSGPYMVSPDDARLMRRADASKGEAGGWAVYIEGVDSDGDGFYNEDGRGGVDINRNFMHQYPYFAPDAGRHMVSESETRALLDFVITHRNIAAILTFGLSDNLMVTPGRTASAAPIALVDFALASNADARRVGMFADAAGGRGGFGGGVMFMGGEGGRGGRGGAAPATAGGRGMPARSPATTLNAGDVEYLRAIADKYRELTGLRSAGMLRTPAGAFFEYGYYQFGVPSFSTPGWGLPAGGRGGPGPAGGPPAAGTPAGMAAMGTGRGRGGAGGEAASGGVPEAVDLRLLRWMDAEKVDGFAAWAAFKHPTLGDVEIGGFKPHVTVNPPTSKIAELGAGHTTFVLHLTSLFPRVRIAGAAATSLGGGLYRIKADIENRGYLPTALAHAVVARAVAPAMVQIGVPPESIITGHEKTSFIQAIPGTGSRRTYEWVITGKPGAAVTVKVATPNAGSDTATVTLQ
ncbi:MAG: M14 family metallopeptidase [Acidobacteriota bacterium]